MKHPDELWIEAEPFEWPDDLESEWPEDGWNENDDDPDWQYCVDCGRIAYLSCDRCGLPLCGMCAELGLNLCSDCLCVTAGRADMDCENARFEDLRMEGK